MQLKDIHRDQGQSIWLDYIRRHLLTSGELARLVKEDGVRGVTSNPSIFEKAIAGSNDYDDALARYEKSADQSAAAIYEYLAIADIQQAADVLRPVYDDSARHDGYVSMEVSPYLANDTSGTVREALRLWKRVGRDNVMIKVPATQAGLLSIEQLIGQGINVNVTLLFSRKVCRLAAEAFMRGLDTWAAGGGDITRVASVASLFVSRLDVLVDPMLATRDADLVGKVAIANAKLAYQDWKTLCSQPRWQALAARGARAQRLLWASTSSKDPRMSDVAYVQALLGRDTVDTLPPTTLDALRDHGEAASHLEDGVEEAKETLARLARLDISVDALTDQLLSEGVQKFSASFDQLLGTIEAKREAVLGSSFNRMAYHLPAVMDTRVKAAIEEWRKDGKVRRLWARDASLWTGTDESRWLDWLTVTDRSRGEARELPALPKGKKCSAVVVLGMGGSSLCPDVLSRTFGVMLGKPELLVLDSTDPAQIRAIEERIDLQATVFIVSSKSGSTLEPNILKDYFFDRVSKTFGPERASEVAAYFIAVTDPGSALERAALAQGFARVFFGVPGIGGRYSALSNFGLVPAALMGIDVPSLLARTEYMVHACAACVPPEHNPGVLLGLVLGTLCKAGHDKVTFVTSPGISALGAWLEQLLAESTGKNGRGIIPIDTEAIGGAAVYGADRVFVYLRLGDAPDSTQDAAIDALQSAGQPVIRILMRDIHDLGQEFFRWEIATAVAGSVLGINAFNQPDVEASKLAAKELTDAYEKAGKLPDETPFLTEGSLSLYADERTHAALKAEGLVGYLKAHFASLNPGDYFALLAYLERNETHTAALQSMRHAIRDSKHVATCVGFGPRFLHSTGQAYKGGPNTGVFLQLTCDDANDIAVPGRRFTFGVVKAAQARGDLQVLQERGRRALRVHLGNDVEAGLAALAEKITQALA